LVNGRNLNLCPVQRLGKPDLLIEKKVISLSFEKRVIQDPDLDIKIPVGSAIGTRLPLSRES
jgi:hypothetical protein